MADSPSSAAPNGPPLPPLTPIRQKTRSVLFSDNHDSGIDGVDREDGAPACEEVSAGPEPPLRRSALASTAAAAAAANDDAIAPPASKSSMTDSEAASWALRMTAAQAAVSASPAESAAALAAAATAALVSSPQPVSALSPEPSSPRKRAFAARAVVDGGDAGQTVAAGQALGRGAGATAGLTAQAAPRPAAGVSATSPSRHSRTAWPWYFVCAVAGAANESYASFIPRKKTGTGRLAAQEDELPDIDQVDWWYTGGAEDTPVPRVEEGQQQEDEEKRAESPTSSSSMATDDEQSHSKRVKLSEQGSGVPSATSSPAGPSARSASSVTVASPLSAVTRLAQSNVLSSFGQDAFFALSQSQLGCCVLGVADGVGGWRDNGVDSGEISRAIMKASRDIALRQSMQAARGGSGSGRPEDAAGFTLSPSDILTRAYAQVKGAGEVEAGSTTACIVALTRTPVTTQTQFDAEQDVRRQHAAAAAAADAAAAEAASAAASSSNMVGAVGSVAASMMLDIAAAVSLQSEQFVASVIGRSSEDMSDEHAVSAPIRIPAQENAVTVSVSPSPEPLLPSSPPTSISVDVAAAVLSVTAPGTPDTPPSLLSPSHSSAAAAAPASSQDSDSVYLSAANLGDSGYLILRRENPAEATGPYRIVTASDLQRTGRTVKQLAVIPAEFANQQYCDDSPSEAMLDAHRVEENDLLVLASDGLWDNLIASEFEYSFLFGWRMREEPLGTQSRKERMGTTIESIVATAVTQLDQLKAQAAATAQPSQGTSRVSSPSMLDDKQSELKEDASRVQSPSPVLASRLVSSASSSALSSLPVSSPPSGLTSRCASSSTLSSIANGPLLLASENHGHSRSASAFGEGEMHEVNGTAGDATMTDDVVVPAAATAPASAAPATAAAVAVAAAGTAAAAPLSSGASPRGASSASTAPATPEWDSVETRLVADALQSYAGTFMRQPDGKPDDLSILVAKIKKHRRSNA